MAWDAWVTLGCVGLVLALMAFTRIAADVAMIGALTLLLVLRIITPEEALSGLSNEGMVTVGVLYIVVAGLENTGGTSWIVQRLLGEPESIRGAIVKLMSPVSLISAFLNNTPVVAMFLPAVNDWAKRHNLPVSKLMIPLSYAAILGGCCTLIGTSTNLVVNGLVIDQGLPSLRMFDITWVGLPCAILGFAFILFWGDVFLPDRRPAISELSDPKEYTVEMIVEPGSPLVGKTLQQAGLRRLGGTYVAEINRDDQIIPAVGPHEVLRANDRLIFVGVVESVVDLQKIRGLKLATDQVFKLDAPRANRCLIEAVVSNRCPIVGQTIRDGRFRNVYNAAVIAVARAGERIHAKIGDIVLQPGDTLLVEAHPSFAELQRQSRHFYLVSRVENSTPPLLERAVLAVVIMVAMILVASFELLSMLQASMIAAGLMIITRCCSTTTARRTVDWQVLMAIAASFGLGRALQSSGAAAYIANELIGMAGGQPWIALAVVYGVALLLTELVTNNAAAVLVFPIALATAGDLGVSATPFIMTVMMAASCGFATPLGYQTHMMVYGPGGYRFSDFLRIGIPLDLLIWAGTVALTPLVFPFHLSAP